MASLACPRFSPHSHPFGAATAIKARMRTEAGFSSINFAKNIKVKQQRIKRNILIFVEDDGPGISALEYENVFKPFYKIDKSRNQKKSSVGLGLSIASDIIRSHGGNIKLGKSEMGGLKIKIVLPV